jgi:protein arginine kinase activator
MPRTVHVTDIKHGKVEQMHLCQLCAANVYAEMEGKKKIPVTEDTQKQDISVSSVPDPGQADLGSALGEFLHFLMTSMKTKDKLLNTQKTPCPNCGITLQEIADSKRLGCPACYDHFSAELEAVLRSVQGGMQHVGKVPKQWAKENAKRLEEKEKEADIHERIRLLKSKQAKAIKVENYEVAGILKIKIEELEKELNDSVEPTPPSSEDQ